MCGLVLVQRRAGLMQGWFSPADGMEGPPELHVPRRRRSNGYRPGIMLKPAPLSSPLPPTAAWSPVASLGKPRLDPATPWQSESPASSLAREWCDQGQGFKGVGFDGQCRRVCTAQPSLGDAPAPHEGVRDAGGPTQSSSSCASEATQFGRGAFGLHPNSSSPSNPHTARRCVAGPGAPKPHSLRTLNLAGDPATPSAFAARQWLAPVAAALSLEELLKLYDRKPPVKRSGFDSLSATAAAAANAAAAAVLCAARDTRAAAAVRTP